jgi:hypothetical protein
VLLINIVLTELRHRWRTLRDTGDAGYTTETVIIIGLLAAAAIAVIGIVIAKLVTKANGIDLG